MTAYLEGLCVATDVVCLDDPAATDVDTVGAKAANLAGARRAGLPVLDGFVLPVPVTANVELSGAVPEGALLAYRALSDGGRRPVVVRSSSPHEDGATSSQAGQFTSVVDVLGPDAFVEAVREVAGSGGGRPMAVLVQPHLDPAVAGVAFGLDPVTGRTDRLVVAAVAGGPQALVSGEVTGDRYELGRRGRLLAVEHGDGGTRLDRGQRAAIVALARAASRVYGGPQDVEWAITDAGDTVLLQTRPVTARALTADGPRYGPGPLAETFPAPLAALEQDLWLPPLRAALVEVAALTGRLPRRRADRRTIVVSPGGWAALDLELVDGPSRRGLLAKLDPRPSLRRLAVAWRVGRLTAAFDGLAADVLAATDAALAAVPALDELTDTELLAVLDRSEAALRSLHGHEILAGMVRPADGPTGAEVALHALWRARRNGLDPEEAVAAAPEILALTAPRIGGADRVPADATSLRPATVDDLGVREALRLRVRWVHELTARVADELGRRLVSRGLLDDASDVRHVDRAALDAAVLNGQRPSVVPVVAGPPLPAAFRLAADGTVVADGATPGAGTGAGGGRGAGPVHHGDDPPHGAVLVVPVLDPRLAVWLPRLAGLVAETGSPLSHLAILAREHGVATVVGYPGALQKWEPGEVVVVDGATGDVTRLEDRAVVR